MFSQLKEMDENDKIIIEGFNILITSLQTYNAVDLKGCIPRNLKGQASSHEKN